MRGGVERIGFDIILIGQYWVRGRNGHFQHPFPVPLSLPLQFSTFRSRQKGGTDRMEMAEISLGRCGPGEVMG